MDGVGPGLLNHPPQCGAETEVNQVGRVRRKVREREKETRGEIPGNQVRERGN